MLGHPRPPPLPLLRILRGFRYLSSYNPPARNLAARHWDFVRAHSPSHPAARHVIDREATKAAIADFTGLRTATDVQPVSAPGIPREVVVRGVKVPLKPRPPESDVCVYDLYLSSLDDYKRALLDARTQLQSRSVPISEWPDDVRGAKPQDDDEQPLDSLNLDPSMKAFFILEKKLGQKKS
ncbi:hypothetical protein FRC12_009771 [Ceratobasidium sp. 428]|nr:hypothetical protein FRC12_009771 [Ceratobasidium sp. 428]